MASDGNARKKVARGLYLCSVIAHHRGEINEKNEVIEMSIFSPLGRKALISHIPLYKGRWDELEIKGSGADVFL